MRQIILVLHNIRSAHNVGSLLRTAEGLGVKRVIFSGYTPYPHYKNDDRLPHIAKRVHSQITKTALGAETQLRWQKTEDIINEMKQLKATGFMLAALEQTNESTALNQFKAPDKIVLIPGNEVSGQDPQILSLCAVKLEIPMFGKKESFNVSVSTAMALYQLRFSP